MSNSLPEKIPACALNLLAREEWFDNPTVFERVNLTRARWYARLLSSPRINRSDVSVITLRRTIHYRKPDRFNPHTAGGLALLAHEIKHVEQYLRDGWIRFNFNYIRDFIRYKGYSRKIAYEKEAYALEDDVRKHLQDEFTANQGTDPCQEMDTPHTPNDNFVKTKPGRFHIPV